MFLLIVSMLLTLVAQHDARIPCEPPEYDQVILFCGSDGHTYTNLCEFKIAKLFNPYLLVYSFGPCKHIPRPSWNELWGNTTELPTKTSEEPSSTISNIWSAEVSSHEETGTGSGEEYYSPELPIFSTELPTESSDEIDVPTKGWDVPTTWPPPWTGYSPESTVPKDYNTDNNIPSSPDLPSTPRDYPTTPRFNIQTNKSTKSWFSWIFEKANSLMNPPQNKTSINKVQEDLNEYLNFGKFPIGGTSLNNNKLRYAKTYKNIRNYLKKQPQERYLPSKGRLKNNLDEPNYSRLKYLLLHLLQLPTDSIVDHRPHDGRIYGLDHNNIHGRKVKPQGYRPQPYYGRS